MSLAKTVQFRTQTAGKMRAINLEPRIGLYEGKAAPAGIGARKQEMRIALQEE